MGGSAVLVFKHKQGEHNKADDRHGCAQQPRSAPVFKVVTHAAGKQTTQRTAHEEPCGPDGHGQAQLFTLEILGQSGGTHHTGDTQTETFNQTAQQQNGQAGGKGADQTADDAQADGQLAGAAGTQSACDKGRREHHGQTGDGRSRHDDAHAVFTQAKAAHQKSEQGRSLQQIEGGDNAVIVQRGKNNPAVSLFFLHCDPSV